MNFFQALIASGVFIFAFMTAIWIASLILKNTSIVDIFWGLGFVLTSWLVFLIANPNPDIFKLILLSLVSIWGLRLSIYIFIRNHRKPEDFRYKAWREEHGPNWWWYSFFQTFLLQGLFMWIISTPLSAAFISTKQSFIPIAIIGLILWIIGFYFEAMGDYQLSRFKSNPSNKGKVLDTGVWRYSRHPNYFGDSAQWWGFFILAASFGAYWTIYSPILMTLLLLRVSGVTLLEKTLKETKPQYKEYIETTSSFIPWFPKKKENNSK